jgi:replication-associated recombination protein RarA
MNLAANLRPKNFTEFVGQEHLAGEQAILRRIIKSKLLFRLFSGDRRAAAKPLCLYYRQRN